ncbi:MAG: thiamine pyrophosphate-binding protein [Rhodospirillales bacterium CG15_BIG_FIL_POST_REV_8_21_14_020_66_15]|nr:MAG: thiamine pyrophosphate-binding protein [Rhodospirillales bacterium CG15_BIG_FIL_POST_REV_8_21_14_020_66_15]
MPQGQTGARLLVETLVANGVDRAFCVPGESYLAVLDAMVDAPGIDLVICRQEGGAAIMADADGKMTGRPGICFVTRGPGATNASAGVHIAFQDSTPMILFIGQVARHQVEREAFQEIDYRRMFGQMAKWVAQIEDPARVPEYVSHAFHTAMSGRPGPVVLALPEDMLTEDVAEKVAIPGPAHVVQAHPGPDAMAGLRAMLETAERPLMILGGGSWTEQAAQDIRAFAEASNIPTGVSFRRQDLLPNDHPLYAGDVGIGINPKLAERVRTSDLVLAVGPRLGEMTTGGYTLFDIPVPRQRLVHVHPGAEELGRVYRAELAINSGMPGFAAAARAMQPVTGRWDNWAGTAHDDYLAWTEPPETPGDVQLGKVIAWLRDELPADAVICNGAGNYTAWVHRFYRYRGYATQLAPTSGSMGYGVPAAVAAKLRHPERDVVAFAGDGCFQMTGQELATAKQYGANVIFIVVNNGMYGTIRMHQEREYPGRVSGTGLVNPDFAALAKAYGATGEVVTETSQFMDAFARARAADSPALIELRTDPDAITPSATLTGIRAQAEAKVAGNA